MTLVGADALADVEAWKHLALTAHIRCRNLKTVNMASVACQKAQAKVVVAQEQAEDERASIASLLFLSLTVSYLVLHICISAHLRLKWNGCMAKEKYF